jgi:transmembrane sensor
MTIDPKLLEEACDWLVALEGDTPDYDAFTLWLEASPAHVAAYDAALLLEERITAQAPKLFASLPANDIAVSEPSGFGRRSIAAALAVAIAVPASLWLTTAPEMVEVASAGAPQTFALDTRTRITLDRSAVLKHEKGDTSQVELARGAANFDVRHDPKARFKVMAGDVSITDLGTRFEVQRNGAQVGVAVTQGSVSVAFKGGKPVTLTAGQRAFAEAGGIRVETVDPTSVGSWQRGQLIFRNAPLPQVALEISRYTTKPVVVDPALQNRRFSGVLTIGDGRALDKNLADFMGLPRADCGASVQLGAGC